MAARNVLLLLAAMIACASAFTTGPALGLRTGPKIQAVSRPMRASAIAPKMSLESAMVTLADAAPAAAEGIDETAFLLYGGGFALFVPLTVVLFVVLNNIRPKN
eukprot:CAMPEP_0173434222 /NCGR_PEP_ID=MMETSP1357-20121228/12284_1 /TAXON_ID=77926 /ORGANISM="Hemiselmis rufescens, Strain PCC563" /LENGTH=103 /DNA_ID=CAMNT_0014399037 /DNA_START=13 /DNA_END=324 /DNA_ORIENTATION=+